MADSIRHMSLSEERRRQSMKYKFTVAQVAKHLEISPATVRAAIRRLRIRMDERLSQGQAAMVILHIREQQGDKILRSLEREQK
jgi:hypothetical protein